MTKPPLPSLSSKETRRQASDSQAAFLVAANKPAATAFLRLALQRVHVSNQPPIATTKRSLREAPPECATNRCGQALRWWRAAFLAFVWPGTEYHAYAVRSTPYGETAPPPVSDRERALWE